MNENQLRELAAKFGLEEVHRGVNHIVVHDPRMPSLRQVLYTYTTEGIVCVILSMFLKRLGKEELKVELAQILAPFQSIPGCDQ